MRIPSEVIPDPNWSQEDSIPRSQETDAFAERRFDVDGEAGIAPFIPVKPMSVEYPQELLWPKVTVKNAVRAGSASGTNVDYSFSACRSRQLG